MANIHTPQGFRANFLSTQSGGRGPAFVNLNTPQPKADASSFLVIKDSSQPVKTFGKGKDKIIYFFNTPATTDTQKQQFVEALNKIDISKITEILTKIDVDGVEVKTPAASADGTTPPTRPSLGEVVRIKEFGAGATTMKDYDKISETFYGGLETSTDPQTFFITHINTKTITDPFACTALLEIVKYPHNNKVFSETKTAAEYWVNNTYSKTLTAAAKSALGLAPNFADNLSKMAAKANEWYGPFHFINDGAGESNYEKSLVIFKGRDYVTVNSLPRTPKILKRFGEQISFEQLQTRLQYLRNKINEISNKSLIELKRGYMVLFPTMVGGATTEQFNNAEIFNNYFQDKLVDLQSRNKSLSENSKNKIFKIIEEISDRENYLKSINDSIEVILKNHNYDTEEVNDLKAYQDLLEERNKVMNILNKGNIKIVDVFKTLDV
jgi:hypothetical protein